MPDDEATTQSKWMGRLKLANLALTVVISAWMVYTLTDADEYVEQRLDDLRQWWRSTKAPPTPVPDVVVQAEGIVNEVLRTGSLRRGTVSP